jgi:ribosome biogenesis protein ENP2
MPEWLSNAKKRALTKDEDYRKRLELIQDFEMTTASQCIKMTKDGEHIIVTGTYPPLVRCYTTSDMAMKFQRGLSCDVVAMETLSDDFGKLCFLQSDRTLSFHAPYGAHYSTRVPKFGRDIKYNWDNCDMYVAASGDEVYRLNLETGQFKEPFQLSYTGCNKVTINPCHSLVACGGESSVCEFWDSKSRKAISKLTIDKSMSTDITALKFDTDGLTLAVGTSNGNCILYDIRSSNPIYTKEHQYGLPLVDITFHNSSRHIISTDKKIVKIWERDEPNQGKIMTNIETPCDINNVLVVDDRRGQSGVIMLTGEQSRVMTYFVPQLGPAPRWCNFLENLTEELEETAGQSVYEDYKFLTKAEIDELGATGLIGTPMLKGYMHGFFIDMKLYNKLRAVSKPFEYEEHRKKKIRDKIEANRQSRITAKQRLPKVNRSLAEKFMLSKDKESNKVEVDEDGNVVKSASAGKKKLVDDRFSSLFEREEFEQDEEAIEYKLRNPSKGNNNRGNGDDSDDDLADMYTAVEGLKSQKGRRDDDSDDDDEVSHIQCVHFVVIYFISTGR